jgi:acyl-CoA thioester hydrolase
MKRGTLTIRVRYAETDTMGIAHHGSYFDWMEAARAEMMRAQGMSYRELEERGFLLPVREAYCRYRKSLSYDDTAIVEATLSEIGGASVKISYRIVEERSGHLVAEGYTLHPFTKKDGRVVKTPGFFIDLFGDPASGQRSR